MNVLFVCTGNTCRSPMAEGYLSSKGLPLLSVRSRGLSADFQEVSENSRLAMSEKGIDISNHVSRPLNTGDIAWADRIICMSLSHKTAIAMFAGEEKLSVLGEGIPDPFGGDIEVYRLCRDEIFSAIDKLLENGFFSEAYIEALTEDRIPEIAEIERLCFSSPWSQRVIKEALLNGTKFFTVVENGRALGYVGISCVLDEGYIANIAVLPEHRKKGLATRLLERVFSLARDEGLSFVTLEVRESNWAAVSLYEKLGFKTEGKRPKFYSAPIEDALIMTKRF